MRRTRRIGIVIGLLIALGLSPAASAQVTHPTGRFVLTNGAAELPYAIDHPWPAGVRAMFAAIEIEVNGSRVSGGDELPVVHSEATGSEQLHVAGTYDAATGTITGTFTFTQHLDFTSGIAATWDMTWTGGVSGTVNATDAPLLFDGTATLQCAFVNLDEPCNGGSDPLAVTVTFAVNATTPTTIPNTRPKFVASGVSGPVYWSSADEADLEPAQRTWTKLESGARTALPERVTIRTGVGGTVKLDSGHDVLRLGQSTVFTVYTEGALIARTAPRVPTWAERWEGAKDLVRVLAAGYADYRRDPGMTTGPVEPGSRAGEAMYGANGSERAYPQGESATRFTMKVAKDGTTTVTAKKGPVVVEHVSGSDVVLRKGESLRSTAQGLGPIEK